MPRYLAGLCIAVYFLASTWRGLISGFNHDDLMNLTFALRDGWAKVIAGNLVFFSTVYRPFGALFYLTFHSIFGLNSVPFRIFCFGALGLNLWLLYRLTARASRSVQAGLIAPVLLAWHGNLAPLYFGSGNCYDVFAVTFYLAALTFYLHAREQGILREKRLAMLGAMQICAMNSKEWSASLPLLILACELLFFRPRPSNLRWLTREGRAVTLTAILSALYSAGKVLGPGSLVGHEAYAPRVSLDTYFTGTAFYLNEMLYHAQTVDARGAVLFAAVLIGGVLLLRNRGMALGAVLVLVAPLPVLLITPRGLGSHYITMAGLSMWAASALNDLRERFTTAMRASQWETRYASTVVFAGTMALMLWFHLPHRQFRLNALREELTPIQQGIASWQRHPEWWRRRDQRILIVKDPFGVEPWATIFIAGLVSGNPAIQAFRLKNLDPRPDAEALKSYTLGLTWSGGEFVETDPAHALNE